MCATGISIIAACRRAFAGGSAPTSPEFCTPALLEGLAGLSAEFGLPVITHIYESRGMAVAGRLFMPEHDGSQVKYLRSTGLLGANVGLAHSVWMRPDEIEILAETGTNVILNPVGNLKTRSGVPPIRGYLDAGVPTAIGCDNCSCGDSQNMFHAMKAFAGLAAVTNPEPGPPTAADTIACATLGRRAGARACRGGRRGPPRHEGRPLRGRPVGAAIRPAQQRGAPDRLRREAGKAWKR